MPQLRLIIGRAGSGKTHTCLTEIAAELSKAPLGPPLILVVPDQATFQMERALVQAVPSGGFIRARVLSFNRLALAILAEVGGLAKPALGPLGRQMLLRSLLHEHAGSLHIYGRAARQPGFAQRLEVTIGELAHYGHSPRHLADLAGELTHGCGGAAQPNRGSVVERKMADLALLWEAFRQALMPDHADPYQYLSVAAEKGGQSALVRDAEVWVDGFAGFTPQEHRMLAMLVQHARSVHLALCLDPQLWSEGQGDDAQGAAGDQLLHDLRVDPLGLFHRTKETGARVLLAARKAGVAVAPPLLLQSIPLPRFCSPTLRHIEGEFGKPVPRPLTGPPRGVRLVEAANRRAEVEAAGREILRLCRDEGYRFRDIALVTRDLAPYQDCVAAVFADLGIPCFIDSRRAMAHHPVVELIRSSLEVILSRWQLQPLIRCLKTDLLPLSRSEADTLENYALEHGLHGKAWQSERPWAYRLQHAAGGAAQGEEEQLVQQLDAVRRRLAGAFLPLTTELAGHQVQVRAACEAVYRFLQQMGVPERLERWAAESISLGQLQEGMTHQQVWDSCVVLLEEMAQVLGHTVMAPAEFCQVLEAGLENLHLGLIPPALDQVLVGSIDRSRQPALRAAFILGVGERSFPASGTEDSMFTDAEREYLGSIGFALGPTATEQALQEQYLGYIAFTRAAEYLWVSYPLASEDGRALAPSSFIARLRAALPELPLEVAGNEPAGSVEEALPWLTSPRRVAAVAVRRLQQGPDPAVAGGWRAAAELVKQEGAARHVLSSLKHSHDEPPLSPLTASALVGPLRFSVSRLEAFAACPFQHFAQYLLGLRERQEYRVQYTDIGLLVHESLHLFVQELRERGVDWADIPEEDAEALADSLIDRVAPRLRHEVLMSSARYQYLVMRMKRVLHSALWAWAQHARQGRFRPVATEVSFGVDRAVLPGLRLSLPDGRELLLQGRIDRVDASEGESGVYLRVIDYKGSSTGFSLSDVFHGLRLQLPVYLAIALQAAEQGHLLPHRRAGLSPEASVPIMPAGAYYFNVREPSVDATSQLDEAALERELLKAFRLKGVSLGSPEAICLAEEAAQGLLIPARLTKGGAPYSDPLVVSQHRVGQLMDLTKQRMAASASRILAGEVAARPYRYGTQSGACRFCRYHVVCHFDPQVEGDRYRPLEHRENRRAWELFDQESGRPDADASGTPKGEKADATVDQRAAGGDYY